MTEIRERKARLVLAAGLAMLVLLALAALLRERPAMDVEGVETLYVFDEPPHVRVRLTALGGDPVRLGSDAGLLVRSIDDAGDARSGAEGGAALTVEMREGLPHALGRPWASGLEIAPASPSSLLAVDDRLYPGVLRVLPDERRGLVWVLSVPLETYLAHVLPSEMPLGSADAALEAQAVAARSYTVATMLRRRTARWDLVDSEASQVFGDHGEEVLRAARHVRRTEGLVLVDDGRPLPAYYSATCGGTTRGNDVAFGESPRSALGGVRCGACDRDRFFRWTLDLDARRLARAAGLGNRLLEVEIAGDSEPEADARLLLRGPGGRREIALLDAVRMARGGRLLSRRLVSARLVGDRLHLVGRGFGHGVGLCQNGARAMARAGRGARGILAHYYPGAAIARLDR